MANLFTEPFKIKFSNAKNEFLEIDVSGYLNGLARDLLNSTRDIAKAEYYSIIKSWSEHSKHRNVFAIVDMYRAIDNKSHLNIESGGKVVSATVTYWVDAGKMTRVKSADEWMTRWRNKLSHKPGLDGAKWQDLPSNEYRAQLMFEEGIIGLPKQSHFRRDPQDPSKPFWENPNKEILTPLEKVIQKENNENSQTMQYIDMHVLREMRSKGY